jgi:hypothetical protein
VRRNNLATAACAALLSLAAFACASRPPDAPGYPLSDEIVRTVDGALLARVPRGWTSAGGEVPPGVAAVLVSDDRSALIVLRELSLDVVTGERVRREGLGLLARLSLAFRADSARPAPNVPVTEYRLGQTDVCAFELIVGSAWKSVVVAGFGGRYYECEASAPASALEAARPVAGAQKAFLASLTTSIRG